MPRQPRLDVPGALHHIMVRGNNKANIFSDDQDRSKFLQRLGENITGGVASTVGTVDKGVVKYNDTTAGRGRRITQGKGGGWHGIFTLHGGSIGGKIVQSSK